jgi:hypothetical protein
LIKANTRLIKADTKPISYRLLAIVLRAALIVALVGAGWIVYKRLPNTGPTIAANNYGHTLVEIVLQPSADMEAAERDIPIEISPVDIIAVRHEFFVEPRAGQRFDDFLHERMKGRSPISTRLNKEGRTSVTVPQGNWWIHAVLSSDENLEWRLPIYISGGAQTIELTTQNAYTRSKSF